MKLEDFVGKNPFDKATWPEKITAKVVQPGPSPRLYGYELHQDLAKNYRWSDDSINNRWSYCFFERPYSFCCDRPYWKLSFWYL